MASRILSPSLLLAPGPEPQNNASRAATVTSGGQGIVTSGVWLENKTGAADRADENTVETTVLGFCTGVLDSNYQPLAKGEYLSTDQAGYAEYIPDAQLLANGDLFIMGEDGVGTTIAAVIAGGATIAAGLYVSLINSIGTNVDDMARYGVDASRQKIIQVLDSSSASATQGTLIFQIVRKYTAGKAVASDPTVADTSAADWVVKRVNA